MIIFPLKKLGTYDKKIYFYNNYIKNHIYDDFLLNDNIFFYSNNATN